MGRAGPGTVDRQARVKGERAHTMSVEKSRKNECEVYSNGAHTRRQGRNGKGLQCEGHKAECPRPSTSLHKGQVSEGVQCVTEEEGGRSAVQQGNVGTVVCRRQRTATRRAGHEINGRLQAVRNGVGKIQTARRRVVLEVPGNVAEPRKRRLLEYNVVSSPAAVRMVAA